MSGLSGPDACAGAGYQEYRRRPGIHLIETARRADVVELIEGGHGERQFFNLTGERQSNYCGSMLTLLSQQRKYGSR